MAARPLSCPSQASTPTLEPRPLGEQQVGQEESRYPVAMVTTNDPHQLIHHWASGVSLLSDAPAQGSWDNMDPQTPRGKFQMCMGPGCHSSESRCLFPSLRRQTLPGYHLLHTLLPMPLSSSFSCLWPVDSQGCGISSFGRHPTLRNFALS